MTKIVILCALVILTSCATQKSSGSAGHTRTKAVEMLDDQTYKLTELSEDKTYGFAKTNPVKVGSDGGSGPKNERRFLNGLAGPNGEQLSYSRAGSCCPFKTPNGLIDNSGMLDIYRITWTGSRDTLQLYLNMYDKGDLKIPAGLTAKK